MSRPIKPMYAIIEKEIWDTGNEFLYLFSITDNFYEAIGKINVRIFDKDRFFKEEEKYYEITERVDFEQIPASRLDKDGPVMWKRRYEANRKGYVGHSFDFVWYLLTNYEIGDDNG